MNKYSKLHKAPVVILAISAFGLGVLTAPTFTNSASHQDDPTKTKSSPGIDLFSYLESDRPDLDIFWEVWDTVKKKHVNASSVSDDKALIYGATKGMIESIGDPYTVFMDPEETEEFMTSLDGQLNGIGAELEVKDQNLVVVSPIKGSPAEAAGLQPGDIIYKINGELASELTLFDAVKKIRGPRGTQVTLTIIRDTLDEPLDIEITRDIITIDSITYEPKDGNIAYVALSQFTDHTTAEFNKVINQLLIEKPDGMILDLRYNGGGYLDISVDMVSEFIDGNKSVVKIESRNHDEDKTINVTGNARLNDIPLVVLVNEGSASASEIVAGAIQDHQRGIIIGTKTFGKGSVQEVIDNFRDGSSLRVTTAKWFTPNGRSIDEEGIDPDRIVELDPADLEQEIDTQLEAALEYLRGL